MPSKQYLDQITDMVEEVLRTCEYARNSDKRLIYEILVRYYKLEMAFNDFLFFPTFESVTRARRELQNTIGKYPPTDEDVCKRRGIEFQEYHDYYSEYGIKMERPIHYPKGYENKWN